MRCLILSIAGCIGQAAAALTGDVTEAAAAPVVSLAQGTFSGGSVTSGGISVEYFKGLRYAAPLNSTFRFKAPAPVPTGPATPTQTATTSGAGCGGAEDCLFLDVYRPAGVQAGDDVPVVAWTHGGGFTMGSPAQYPGTAMAVASQRFGQPVIHVSLAYRLGGFGFLSGEAMVSAAGNGTASLNAALWDQREAYRWIQANIASFGGDPNRVTLWGQSAGAQSVGTQLTANGGDPEGLFHGVILQSGGPMSGVFLDAEHPQNTATFSNVVAAAGCNSTQDQIACLRGLSYAALVKAFKAANTGVVVGNNVWQPSIHSTDYFLSDRPRALISQGKVADIPFLMGNVHDEGGFFGSMFQSQVQTEAEFTAWFTGQALVYPQFTNATSVMDQIYELYPDVPAQGCPYASNATATSGGFSHLNYRWYEPLTTNQYKRAVSLWSDWNFVAGRRYLMQQLTARTDRKSKMFGYLFAQISLQANATTSLEREGCAHTFDLPYLFCTWGETCTQIGSGSLQDDRVLYDLMQSAWVGFINSGDPNSILNADWPEYGTGGLLQSLKGSDYNTTIPDTYREGPISFLISDGAAPILGY